MAKSKGQINYGQRLKAIRPFVDFDYDLRKPLSSAAKAQITAYYGYIQKLTVRQHQIYRSRDRKKLRAVQRFAQHDPNRFQHLKVAFVPNAGAERMRITIAKDGTVRGKTGKIAQVEIPLDKIALVKADEQGRAAQYVENAINNAPGAARYVVQAGEFEVPTAHLRTTITRYVVDLMSRYSSDNFDKNDKNSHFYGNWMFGITGYNFTEQSDMEAYRAAKRRATKTRARDHVTQNRREKRIRENPPGFWVNDTLRQAKRARPPQPDGWRQVNQRQYYEAIYAKGYKEVKGRKQR